MKFDKIKAKVKIKKEREKSNIYFDVENIADKLWRTTAFQAKKLK